MAFFNSAITILQTLVTAIGAGLAVWGVINLLEGYGNDNPGAKSQGIKHNLAKQLEQQLPRKEKRDPDEPDSAGRPAHVPPRHEPK